MMSDSSPRRSLHLTWTYMIASFPRSTVTPFSWLGDIGICKAAGASHGLTLSRLADGRQINNSVEHPQLEFSTLKRQMLDEQFLSRV